MIDDEKPRQKNRKRLWLALTALAVLLALLIVPPFVSVSRYKARITQLISASLGRPVRLSSVEMRLLPRPGFVLSDLSVEEDPAYGTEPILHANSVSASIRLLSLWRGHIELDAIRVDEASLNLVRTPAGRWNLDSLLRTAAAHAQSAPGSSEATKQNQQVKLPYLEATNSRINIKSGVEKLPYSLVDAKFSLEEQSPGDWRVQLRGEPARTDLTIWQADAGVVRLTANLHQAAELRQMPLRADLEWREAQLGQLTRLLLGSDAGWRGDLTGELHLEGTADAAQITTRLRAIGVHRAEFAPAEPMDFDANCAFVAHFSARAMENLICDSPLGSGRIRLSGKLPGQGSLPSFSIGLDHIPVAVALDALRSVRSGFAPGLEATGSASGQLNFSPSAAESAAKPVHAAKSRSAKDHPVIEGPLTGSLKVTGLQFSGSGLNQPVEIPEVILTPVAAPIDQPQALTAATAIFRRRSRAAHHHCTPFTLRVSVHSAGSGCHRPGQGTGARNWPGQRAFHGLAGGRPCRSGFDCRGALDAWHARGAGSTAGASSWECCFCCSHRHSHWNPGFAQRQLEGGVSGQFHPDLSGQASFGCG